MCRIYSLPLYQLSYRWLRLTMKNKFLLARYRKCNIEKWKITIGNHKIDIFMPLHGSRNTIFVRGISSSGRALDLHSRGTGIDTRILQLFSSRPKFFNSLDRTDYVVKPGELAQMVERSLSMREVPGSMPGFSKVSTKSLFLVPF